MIMWIILGSLISIVAIFLIITSIMDRKKNKRLKLEAKKLDILRQNAQKLIAIWVNEVIIHNQNLLKEFVPSIGKIKMKEIIITAKKALILLTKNNIYQLVIESKSDNHQTISKFKELLATNSNNWMRKIPTTVKYFQKQAQIAAKNPENSQFISETKVSIKGVYDEFTK